MILLGCGGGVPIGDKGSDVADSGSDVASTSDEPTSDPTGDILLVAGHGKYL